MRNLTNYIIPPWDSRYGKLGHLWKKHSWNNLVTKFPGRQSTYYYIPGELVINEMNTSRTLVSMDPSTKSWNFTNWISNRSFSRIIEDCTGLTSQEYFDLLVLKINNISDRPRCSYCKRTLSWTGRMSHAYYGDTSWIFREYNYCSSSCRTRNMRVDKDYYSKFIESCTDNIKYILDPRTQIKSGMSQFLRKGSLDDICYFYVSTDNHGDFKFGVSKDPEFRKYNWNDPYESMEILYSSTRDNIAYLEASIKLDLNSSRESFPIEEKTSILKVINKHLLSQITNPFDD